MRTRFITLFLFLLSAGIFAQDNDPVIMSINGKNFNKSEFEYFYHKYNTEDVVDKLTLSDYVALFKNLKLKVAEAEAQGMDTTLLFLSELSGYRSSEAKPYLEALPTDDDLIEMKFNRIKQQNEISHIQISFPESIRNNSFKILPSDTIETYLRAIQIRNRLLKGENFEIVAAEVSEDANIAKSERPGYLGWFAGLMLNPIFEDVVFTTPVNQVTPPIRTNAGYHIVKVHAKKEVSDQINAAHILILCPQNADEEQVDEAKKKMDGIYNEIKNGADFSALAKENSQDPGSAPKGGELGWFGYGAMVREFQDAAFDLKEIGDVSKPFRTQFGFHIVKLLERKPLAIEDKRKDIESTMNSGGYYLQIHQTGIDKKKKEYGFLKNDEGYQMLISKANTVYPTDSAFFAYFETQNIPLFTIGDTNFSSVDFINYLRKNSRSPFTLSTELLIDRLLWFEYACLLDAEDKSLESKYPEFKNQIQEYRDGSLMFEISNKDVWGRASEDTEGLTAFFNRNKKNYTWSEPHYRGYIVLAKDTQAKKKMQKEISKKDPDTAIRYLLDNYIVGDVAYLKVEKGIFKKGDNAFIDEAAFNSGKATRTPDFQDFFLLGKLLKSPETYLDIRGEVIADYQNYLEEMWLKQLNEKYEVVIFTDIINTIK